MDDVFTMIKNVGSAVSSVLVVASFCTLLLSKSRRWLFSKIQKYSLTDEQHKEIEDLDKKINQNRIDLEKKIKESNMKSDKIYFEMNEKLDKLICLLDSQARQLDASQALTKEGFVCILGKDIKTMCQEIEKKNSCSEEEYKEVTQCHKVYKKSGGNGYVDSRIHRVLPEYKYSESDSG